MLAFFFINYFQCVETLCLSAFQTKLALAFDCSLFEVNFAASSASAIFIPAFLFTVYLYNILNLRAVMIVAVMLLFVGAWIRMIAMVNNQFWWINAG